MSNKRSGKNTGMNQVTLCPFRVLGTSTFPSSANTAVLEIDLILANLGARAVAVGSAFEFFRFKKLSAYQYTNCIGPVFDADATGGTGTQGASAADHHLAFIESNAALTGTATTVTQLVQYEIYRGGSAFSRLSIKVPRNLLAANAYKWFNTASTGASTDDLSPGMFVSAVVNGLSFVSGWEPVVRTVIEGVIEFRGMITPALSFASLNDNFDDSSSSTKSMVTVKQPSGLQSVGARVERKRP